MTMTLVAPEQDVPAHLSEREPAALCLGLTHLIAVPPADGTLRPRLKRELACATERAQECPESASAYSSAFAAVRYLLALLVSRPLEDPIVSAVRETALRRLRATAHLPTPRSCVAEASGPEASRESLRQEIASFLLIVEDLLTVDLVRQDHPPRLSGGDLAA